MKKSHVGCQLTNKLKSHIDVRWNTAYDMLQSIIDSHQELYELLQSRDNTNAMDKLTCLSVQEMRHICDLLRVFKNLTTEIEGEKQVTIHKYWLSLREMKQKLEDNLDYSALVEIMKKCVRKLFREQQRRRRR